MASGHLCKLTFNSLFKQLSSVTALRSAQTCLVPMRQMSSYSGHPLDDPNINVEIGVTSDGKTIVCHHPTADIPYDLTQPIERPDPVTNPVETHDQILKAHLSKEVLRDKRGPTIEELSKMFFTTKHRWYPLGQYHNRRRNLNPPKDR